jgi:P-type Cu+ transporter
MSQPNEAAEHREPGSPSVKDPVCGMNADPGSAHRHEHGGATYSFCSSHCLEKFRAEPGKYTRA